MNNQRECVLAERTSTEQRFAELIQCYGMTKDPDRIFHDALCCPLRSRSPTLHSSQVAAGEEILQYEVEKACGDGEFRASSLPIHQRKKESPLQTSLYDADRNPGAVGSSRATHHTHRSRRGSRCNSNPPLCTIPEDCLLIRRALVGQQLRLRDWHQV